MIHYYHLQSPDRVQNFDTVMDFLKVVWAPAGVSSVVDEDRDGEEDGEESPEHPLPAAALANSQAPGPVKKLYKHIIFRKYLN